MEENYIEWLVKRKDPVYAWPVKILMIVGFSVDSILGKARRKKTFDCDKEDVQVIAPANSYVLKDYEKQGMKVIDCTSHNAGADVYALISQKGAQTTKVLFEPGDKMKAAMRRVFPRKFI